MILLVSNKKVRGCHHVSSEQKYLDLLSDIQGNLIELDVFENEQQDLVIKLETRHAKRLKKDLINMQKIIRFTYYE